MQDIASDKSQLKLVHATIKKVTEDIESLSFNTAISQMMVFVNGFTNVERIPVAAMRMLLVLLNPFAPHLTSELWEKLEAKFRIEPSEITRQPWPSYDEPLLVEGEVEIAVQMNGKMRARIESRDGCQRGDIESGSPGVPKSRRRSSGKKFAR